MDGPDYEWNEEIIGEMKSPYAVLDKYDRLHNYSLQCRVTYLATSPRIFQNVGKIVGMAVYSIYFN